MSVVPDLSRSPWAERVRRQRWTDPRLLVGLLLVVVATVTGARLLAGADDTAPVWAVATSVRAGDVVEPDALAVSRVRIADGADESSYLSAGAAPPSGVFLRDLAAGELVPAAAVGAEVADAGADLSLAVEVGDAPPDLVAGDVVDVWAVPGEGAALPTGTGPGRPTAQRVLEGVAVVSVTEAAATLGGTAREVLLRLGSADLDLGAPLAELAAGKPVLVRVGS